METLFNFFISKLLITHTVLAQTQPKISPYLSGGYTPGIIGVRDYANPGIHGLFDMDYNIYMKSNAFHNRNAWQVGEDTGSDVYWNPSVKDQMSVVGRGVGYQVVPNIFYGNLKYSTTYNHEGYF